MKEFSITNEQVLQARKKADNLGVLKNSIRQGKGNFIGFLGEECVSYIYEIPIENTYDYDLKSVNGKKFDVKTKVVTTPPKDDFECSVSDYNTKQDCDYYIFVRILNSYSKGWILGIISKIEFFARAIKHEVGDFDESNNFTFRSDTWNLPHWQLYDFKDLETRIRSS